MEIRGIFQIGEKKYQIFIERKFLSIKASLFELDSSGLWMDSIPVNISASTPREWMEYQLTNLKWYLRKKRRKKRS